MALVATNEDLSFTRPTLALLDRERDEDPFQECFPGTFFRQLSDVRRAGAGKRRPDEAGRGSTYLHLVRYMPTDRVVEHLLGRFSPAADAIVLEWRTAWRRLYRGDPDDLAMGPGVGHPEKDWAVPFRFGLLETRIGRMFEFRRRSRFRPPRLTGHHELEEAVIQLALLKSGIDVAFVHDQAYGEAAVFRPTTAAGVVRNLRGQVQRRKDALLAWWYCAVRYWASEAFNEVCGRTLAVASDPPHAAAILFDMARLGHARAFVKGCRAKSGTWIVHLDAVRSIDAALAALSRAMGAEAFSFPTMNYMEALANGEGLLVQDFVPFAYEHRFFVVAGKIVASTPSDRNLSVVDAIAGVRRLDPRVAVLTRPPDEEGEYDRGATTNVVNRALVAAMALEVRRLLSLDEQAPAATRLGDCIVVDVGSTGPDPSRDAVRLVEVNSIRFAGLYAADYAKVAKAIAASTGKPRTAPRPGDDAKGFVDYLSRRRDFSLRQDVPVPPSPSWPFPA